MRSKVVLGDMATDEIDDSVQLLWVCCPHGCEEVVEELLLTFQQLYFAVDGDLASLVVPVVLDAFCVM